MQNQTTIVITGGHLTPALALIEQLAPKNRWQIYYFGRLKAMQRDHQLSLESQIIPKLGIKFIPIVTGKFNPHLDIENLISLSKIIIGLLHTLYYLWLIKPKIIVSFGGYLGLPTVISGWVLKIPIIIHEQISVAGLANRLSASFATAIAISFPSSQPFYPKSKTIITGNPLISSTFKVEPGIAKKYTAKFQQPDTILVVGGNQGSQKINQTLLKIIPNLVTKYNIIHQIGSTEAQLPEWRTANTLKHQLSSKFANNYYPIKFIPHQEMGSVYSLAKLVICRSGANTISELGALQKPAITIPIEPSLMDEQLRNAELLKNSGLGILIHQSELNSTTLINQIKLFFLNNEKFKLQAGYKKIFTSQGSQNLYNLINKLLNHK